MDYDYVRIQEYTFDLLKETPCGYWINLGWFAHNDGRNRKWVSKTTRNRYAYPTKVQAMENFVARKRRQIGIYRARLVQAENALRQGVAKLENTKEK